MQILKTRENSLKMFHINVCSLNKTFEDLKYLLKSSNVNYSIIAISKTRVINNFEITRNINLKNYNFEYTPNLLLVELCYTWQIT